MKTAKQIMAGIAMLGALLSFTTTASADWSHRGRELRHDRRELGAARRELGRDLRRAVRGRLRSHETGLLSPANEGRFGRLGATEDTAVTTHIGPGVGVMMTTVAVPAGGVGDDRMIKDS
jgi:hypothetical protein